MAAAIRSTATSHASPALITQTIIGFVASALGASLAGYAGVWFGLSRTRLERGFDQRLAWSKDMLRALHATAQGIDDIGETDSAEAAERRLDAMLHDSRVETFNLLVAEARAYASPRALEALNRAAELIGTISKADPETPADMRSMLARQLDALRMASEALCDDARAHLRLEPVVESSWPFDVPPELSWGKVLPPET